MQNTRLNSLVDRTTDGLGSWLQNPWRRFSVLIISLLLGNYVGPALTLVAGQRGQVDIVIAALVVALIELTSLFAYRRRAEVARSLLLDSLNAFKIGFTYSLIVDAFKLGS
jgi:hypothetical protein